MFCSCQFLHYVWGTVLSLSLPKDWVLLELVPLTLAALTQLLAGAISTDVDEDFQMTGGSQQPETTQVDFSQPFCQKIGTNQEFVRDVLYDQGS